MTACGLQIRPGVPLIQLWFGNSVVIVNHRNVPVNLSGLLAAGGEADWQISAGLFQLIPHAAVHIKQDKKGKA